MLIRPETVSVPWLTTCASITRSAAPRMRRPSPVQLKGRTAKPKRAVRSATAPSAPGRTTPGWKISNPIPAIPARKSSGIRFGSISAFSRRVKKPGFTSTICALAVWRTKPLPTVLRPSILFRSAGRFGAMSSITFIRRACSAVRFEALRTARSAHATLRPWNLARPRSEAAASFSTLRRRSLLRLVPLPLIGVEEPMLVAGAIASTSAAWPIHTPADAARAPGGDT